MIQSIERAILIMDIIAKANTDSPTLKYISEKSGLNKSTCSHIIETLIKNSLLLKISASKGYCLGPHAYLWAKDGKFNYNLVKIIAPILKWLNKTTGKATSLANIVSDDKYLLHYYEGDIIFKGKKDSILTDNIFNSATGLHLLSQLNRELIYSIYKKHQLPQNRSFININDFDDLLDFLRPIKSKNIFKFSPHDADGYHFIGYSSLVIVHGQVLGAIGIACSYNDLADNKKEEPYILQQLKTATNEILKRLSQSSLSEN